MDNVWTLMTGECHRGGYMKGIFSEKSTAVKAAHAIIKEYETWKTNSEWTKGQQVLDRASTWTWTNGYDWVEVKLVAINTEVM